MTILTYRGNRYELNNEEVAPSTSTCCYRGVEYVPAEQEVAPAPVATLTYRGVEYKTEGFNALARIQRKQQRDARRAAARKMQHNATAIF